MGIGRHIVVVDAFVLDLGGVDIVRELNGWRPWVELLWVEGRTGIWLDSTVFTRSKIETN